MSSSFHLHLEFACVLKTLGYQAGLLIWNCGKAVGSKILFMKRCKFVDRVAWKKPPVWETLLWPSHSGTLASLDTDDNGAVDESDGHRPLWQGCPFRNVHPLVFIPPALSLVVR